MYFSLTILLITIALQIAVSLIKYKAKQKYLLQFYITNNDLKKSYVNNDVINMDSNDKFKKIYAKNRTCYYSDDMIKIEEFDTNDVLTDKKPYKNILIYNI